MACASGHCCNEAIEETARSDAGRSTALVQLCRRFEVVARVNQLNVERFQKPSQVPQFSVGSCADEQLGLDRLQQHDRLGMERGVERKVCRGLSSTEILDPCGGVSDQHGCPG